MANPYKLIFAAPGAKGFASAAFLARIPLTMAPIGIVAMLSQTHGSYWLAGAVSATYAFTNALASPQISRIVDRYGQTPVVAPATIISLLGFITLIAATSLGWPTWTLFVSAVFAAAMPSIPALVRARWTGLFRGRPELDTAFAFESSADELVYIAGASLSVGLAVSLYPTAGILVAAILMAVGTFALLMQRSTEPPVDPNAATGGSSAFWLAPVQIVTLALIFVGMIFATAEVSAVAITESLGQPGSATYVVGGYAVGSFVVGLILGAMQPAMPLHRQILSALGTLAALQVPLLFAANVPVLAVTVFISGLAVSPTFITAFGLVARRVPADKLTEGMTWVFTGIGIGMAIGAALAGLVVDTFGPRSGFWVSVLAGLAALTTIALGQRVLAGEPRETRGASLPA